MKLTHDLIVIDLETTGTYEYIIEIGAVYLDSKLNMVDSFELLIKPEAIIEPEIELLTGITNSMVFNAALFSDAIGMFENWVEGFDKFKNVRLCAWGNYFDANVFRSLYRKYNRKYPFSGTWYDIKTVVAMWHMLAGIKQDTMGVSGVVNTLGIKLPEGRFHRAGYDALAEALILKRCLRDFSEGFFLTSLLPHQKSTYIRISN
jgi:DNA polymerase III alpha subunit (gram-positive type)